MTQTTAWPDALAPLVAVIAPLVGAPLALITFYLRSLREHHAAWRTEQVRRIDAIESGCRELRRMVRAFERDYTTKEEWLRECLQARQTLNRLHEIVIRLETLHRNDVAAPGNETRTRTECTPDRPGKETGNRN